VQHPFEGVLDAQLDEQKARTAGATGETRRSLLSRLMQGMAAFAALCLGGRAAAQSPQPAQYYAPYYHPPRYPTDPPYRRRYRSYYWPRSGPVTTYALGEEGSGRYTTYALGEEGSGSPPPQEGGRYTTQALGEEGGGRYTTQALGEEG
jgi:hypothetical protein